MKENFFNTFPQPSNEEEPGRIAEESGLYKDRVADTDDDLVLDVERGWIPRKEHETAKIMAEKGPLGLSADGYREMGATPPEGFGYDRSRAFVESMSEGEIAEWLDNLSEKIDSFSQDRYKDDVFARALLPILKMQRESTVRTLRDIGRLPSSYKEE